MKIVHALLMLMVMLFSQTLAQEDHSHTLPQTSAGDIVTAHLRAFNTPGDSLYLAFIHTNISADGLKRIPPEQRLQRFQQMRERMVSLELTRVLSVTDNSIEAQIKTKTDDLLVFTFNFDPQPPHLLNNIAVERTDGPGGRGPGEAQPVAAKKTDQELIEAAKGFVDSLVKADEFSGVVLIAKGGQPIFQQAWGFADKEKHLPTRLDTKFNIGSINKVFTELSIEQLERAGKLSPADTIKKFLPDYPNQETRETVTIQHLLDMASGIGDIFGPRYERTPKENLKTISDFLPLFADQPLAFKPGSQQQYSNGGFIVLGAIIEQASGVDYYTYVRQHIYQPAVMMNTDSYARDSAVANRALGYSREFGQENDRTWLTNHSSLPGRGSSAGGGYSTAEDLLRFIAALKAGKLSSSRFSAQSGIGVAGGAPGLNAALEWDPQRDYAIVVLANYDPPSAERVARQIRKWLPR